MTLDELTGKLDGVRPTGRGVRARCPAHSDHSPSLSIREGERGLLVKCWAGCSLEEITCTLGLTVKDLFFDALSTDPHQRREAMRQRTQATHDAEGRRLDTFRQAEQLIQSARGISIEGWSDDKLNAALNRLGTAYALLDSEGQA
jgi:hypothetical protein